MCVKLKIPREPPNQVSTQNEQNKTKKPAFTPWEPNFVTNKWSKHANHTQLPTPHKERQGPKTRGEVTTVANPPTITFPNPQQITISETKSHQTIHTSPPSNIVHPHNRSTSTNVSKTTPLGVREDGKGNHSTPCMATILQPNQDRKRKNS